MPLSEQEEFEFRLRAEQESRAPQEPGMLDDVMEAGAAGLKGVGLATDYLPGNVRAATLGALASAIGGEKSYGEQLSAGATNIASGEFAPSSGEYFRQMGIPKYVPDTEAPISYFSARDTLPPRKFVPRTKESPDDVISMASDVGIDVLTGAGAAKAFNLARTAVTPGAKKVADFLSQKFGSLADTAAIRHLRPTPKTAQRLGKERLKEIAQEVRASGAIKPFQRVDVTAANLDDLVDEIGAVKGGIVDASTGSVDINNVVKKIDEVTSELRKTEANKALADALEEKKHSLVAHYIGEQRNKRVVVTSPGKEIPQSPRSVVVGSSRPPTPPDPYSLIPSGSPGTDGGLKTVTPGPSQYDPVYNPAPRTTVTPGQMEAEKMAVQGNINYKTDPTAKTQAQRDYARALQHSVEDVITDPNFVRSKEAFGNIAEASGMANRTAGLTDGGGLMGHITDVGIGGGLADELLALNPKAAAAMAARGLTKGRVASTIASGADRASRALQGADLTRPIERLESLSKNVLPLQSGLRTPEQLRLVAQRQKENEITRRPQSMNLSPDGVMQKLQKSPNGQKFMNAIQSAKDRGPDSFGTTYFLLFNSEPEFKKLMQEGEQ